jgi:hypothetical protein
VDCGGLGAIAASEAWKTMPNGTDFVPKPYAVERIEMLTSARVAARDASPEQIVGQHGF